MIGGVYNFWCGAVIYTFQKMMYDKRYRHWLRYFQIPMSKTPTSVKLVGYSKKELTNFWEFSSKLQSFVLKTAAIQSAFIMSLSATSYVMVMHKRYNGKLHSPAVFWSILLVRYPTLPV